MKIIIFILTIFSLLVNTPKAYATEEIEKQLDTSGVETALPNDVKNISGNYVADGTYNFKKAMERLWNNIQNQLSEKLKLEFGFGVKLIMLSLMCALGNVFCTDRKILNLLNIAACSAAALMVAGDMDGIIKNANDAMFKLSDYSKAAMPAIFSAAAACGAPASAAAKYAVASFAIDLLISIATGFILPLINVYFTVSVCRSVFENSILSSVSKFVKWLICTTMTLITMAFTAYISFTGLISGSVDASAVKTARTIIANGLPVVGKLISDASSVILAGATIVKNSAGVYSLIAVCALCSAPFIDLLVKILVFKAAAAAADMVQGGRLSGLINDMGTVFSMLLGLVGCCGIMLFISIISGIKVLV